MLSLIACIGKNRELGKDGHVIWRKLPGFWFKRVTMGHPIIMGRKTYESIPERNQPLIGRTNIVLTSNIQWQRKGVVVVDSLERAIEVAKKSPGGEEMFIGGGAELYHQSMGMADRLYLTLVDESAEADIFFPEYGDFIKVVSEEANETEEGLRYKFVVLEKSG